jgi:hypothetical protein
MFDTKTTNVLLKKGCRNKNNGIQGSHAKINGVPENHNIFGNKEKITAR